MTNYSAYPIHTCNQQSPGQQERCERIKDHTGPHAAIVGSMAEGRQAMTTQLDLATPIAIVLMIAFVIWDHVHPTSRQR